MHARHKVFWLLSVALLVFAGTLVFLNWRSLVAEREHLLAAAAQRTAAVFQHSLDRTESELSSIAAFVAGDPRIQQTFLAGKRAVEAEGGVAGGEQAMVARTELLALVAESWRPLRERFDYRQLHFHLGPGSVSFLRVHKPDKFGDNLDTVRHTIVAANRERRPTSGFETGRVVSGIRGVEPVQAVDPATGELVHVGAVEAGRSFQSLLDRLAEEHGENLAVLLTMDHMRENIWPDLLTGMLAVRPPAGDFYVEASTSAELREVLAPELLVDLWRNIDGDGPIRLRVSHAGRQWSVAAFPLRDYLGEQDPSRLDVGMVVTWQDMSEQAVAFQTSVRRLLWIAVSAWLLVELLLYIGVCLGADLLERAEMADSLKVRIGRNLVSFTAGAIGLSCMSAVQKVIAGFPMDWRGFVIPALFGGGVGWVVGTLVIKLRRRLQDLRQALAEGQRADQERDRLMSAVEQTTETIVITDAEGVILYANPAFEQSTGFTRDEALGQNPRILKSGEHDDAFYREMWDTLLRGDPWIGRMVNRKKNGALYTEEAVISPVRDASGRTINFVAVKRDVTAEIRLEAQLRQAQKMDAVGRLAGGVAHDFNNMLSVILGHAELALDEVDAGGELHASLKEIERAAEHSADLTRQLLAFARKQTVAPEVLDLNKNVAGILGMVRRLIGEDIDLVWRPGSNLWPVKIDPSQIDQILTNLCVNARDAIEDVGEITIETSNLEFDDAYCGEHAGSVTGRYTLLAVSDNGCGMDTVTVDNIFEPFFTTKGVGQGTGLGLATVYGIVKQNDGFINVYSEPDHGTTIKIYLPRYASVVGRSNRDRPEQVAARGQETLLLVEDEPAILKVTRTMLTRLGYQVLSAATPGEALEVVEKHTGVIHLVITDVIMPEMNGPDLVRRLLARHPDLVTLYMSGYTANVIAHRGVLDEGTHFLQKPFTTRALAAKVREALVDLS